MKKVFSILALAAIALLAANCGGGGGGGNTPSGIMKSVYTQMQAGNYDKAAKFFLDNLDATDKEKAQYGALITSDKLKKSAEEKGGIQSFEIVSEKISDDGLSAVVEMKIVGKNGKTETNKGSFVKKDGVWKTSLKK